MVTHAVICMIVYALSEKISRPKDFGTPSKQATTKLIV
jgi:hypothetical protein